MYPPAVSTKYILGRERVHRGAVDTAMLLL